MSGAPMLVAPAWFRSRDAWTWIVVRFVPPFAALNLAWEAAQLPLYDVWEREWQYQAFAVVHCTAGDVLIGVCALMLALIATRAGRPETWKIRRVTLVMIAISLAYTIFSESMNTVWRESWAYSALMPVVPFLGTGLSPLTQWILIPASALRLSQAAAKPERNIVSMKINKETSL